MNRAQIVAPNKELWDIISKMFGLENRLIRNFSFKLRSELGSPVTVDVAYSELLDTNQMGSLKEISDQFVLVRRDSPLEEEFNEMVFGPPSAKDKSQIQASVWQPDIT